MERTVEPGAPLVSVIVPLYDGQAYIEDTLDSLHRQTRSDLLEVIVVDDGSSDDGVRLAEQHPVGARVVRQSHGGVAMARNRGSMLARGTWLAYLDQDDLWHESRVERIAPLLEAGEAGCILTSLTSFGIVEDRQGIREQSNDLVEGMVDVWVPRAELGELCSRASVADVAGSDERRRIDVEEVMRGTVSPTPSLFIRADHLRLIGGWSVHARSIDDWWLMASAAFVEPILRVDQPTHLYRIHAQATSRSTKFWYAYASSLVAMRFGDQYEPRSHALTTPLSNPTVEHMLREVATSTEFSDEPGAAAFARHAGSLLLTGAPVRGRMARWWVLRRAPWLTGIRRRLRRAPQ